MDDLKQADAEMEAINAYLKTLIEHPTLKAEGEYPIVMAMVISEGRKMIGGVLGIQDDLTVVLHEPMELAEGLGQNPQTGETFVNVGFMPVSYMFPRMNKAPVKASLVYYLQASSRGDQKAVTMYAEKLQEMHFAEAGLVTPNSKNNADMSNVSKLGLRNGFKQ